MGSLLWNVTVLALDAPPAAPPDPPVVKNYLLSNSPFSYDGVDYLGAES